MTTSLSITTSQALATLWLLVAGLHAAPASAACNFYPGNALQTHTLALPANLNVPRDALPGTVLYSTEVAARPGKEPMPSGTSPAFALCTAPGTLTRQTTAPQGATSGGSVAHLAQTNLQGIGLRFYFRNNSGRDYRWSVAGSGDDVAWSYVGSWSWYWNGPAFWGVELVKTNAPVASGDLNASDISTQIKLDNLLVATLNVTGTTNLQSQSCGIQVDPVQFGSQMAGNPGIVGSTMGMRDVTIHLRNCPAGLKAIRYQLRAVHGELDPSQAVAALAPLTNAATGYGVQITDSGGAPVTFGTSRPVPSYVAGQAGNFSIALRAAYYRVASHITYGVANSSIEVAMSYE